MAKKKQGKPKVSAEPGTTISPEPIPAKMTNPPSKIVIENYSKVYEHPDILDFVQNYPKNKYLLIKNSKGDFSEIVDGVFQKLLKENKIPKLSPIYFEDCASRNEANYLLHEFQKYKNKESNAFFFHNVAGSAYRNGGNIDLLNDLRDRVSSGRLPLIIIGLKEDVKDSDLPDGFPSFFKVVDLSKQDKLTEKMRGITKKRGCRPKHTRHKEFMKILGDILGDDKNSSLGGYVIKVKTEMERKNLKELRKVYCKGKKTDKQKIDFIYTDSTIKTYIQGHLLYKKIQKLKEKRKKV